MKEKNILGIKANIMILIVIEIKIMIILSFILMIIKCCSLEA